MDARRSPRFLKDQDRYLPQDLVLQEALNDMELSARGDVRICTANYTTNSTPLGPSCRRAELAGSRTYEFLELSTPNFKISVVLCNSDSLVTTC